MQLAITGTKTVVRPIWSMRVLLLVLLPAVVLGQADLNTRQFTLSEIKFEGLKTIEASKAREASGLQTGQTATLQQLKEAAQRLLTSGLFRQVKFQYKYLDKNLIATFVVEEHQATMPCHFDNFAWFTDEELYAAIRQELPNFDGKATEGGEMVETIRRALEKLLRDHKVSGAVEAEMANMGAVHVCKAVDVKLPVCELGFSGVTSIAEKELQEAMKEIFGAEYSRIVSSLIARETIIPMFLQKGYLKVRLRSAQAQISKAAGKCQNQVAVLLPLEEGLSYQWNAPNWTGNQLLTAAILNHRFALKPGDVADGMKIRKGISDAIGEYEKRGYLGVQLKPSTDFDETARTVTYSFTLAEGPQYQVGELTVKGFDAAETRRLKDYWQPLMGKPYELSILEGILKKISADPRKVTNHLESDHQARTANLTLEFK